MILGKGVLTARNLMFIGFSLHVLVAIWNGFLGPSFGAEGDASTYHRYAVYLSNNFETAGYRSIFIKMLGMIYFFTNDSLFWGGFLSCLAWLMSAQLLIKIMGLLSFDVLQKSKVMCFYALIPSAILFTSVTLREPYQLMFVNLAVYSALKILLNKFSGHWLFLLCGIIGAGMLHSTFFAFGLFIVIAIISLPSWREGKKVYFVKLMVTFPFVVAILFYWYSFFLTSTNYGLEDGLHTAIENYQRGGLSYNARAFYKTSVEINGTLDLLTFIPWSFFQYLFEPMPWRCSSPIDVLLFFENILRGWLIWKCLIGLRKVHKKMRVLLFFIFLSYLVLEIIWSVGTINWGTATRHHIPSMGLLLVAAFAFSGRSVFRVGRSSVYYPRKP